MLKTNTATTTQNIRKHKQTTSKIPDEIEIKLQTDIAAVTAVLKIYIPVLVAHGSQ